MTLGTITNPVNGAWNSADVPVTAVQGGRQYWIAIFDLTGGGTIQIRDVASGGKSQTSSQRNLSTFPAKWGPGSDPSNSPMSAYVTGFYFHDL